MNTFNFHDIRVEKANAILRYRRIQRITALLRFVEVFVFLIVLSTYSTQFAFSLKLSGEYFRGISVTLISPLFVFLIGNVIVIVLFLKSGGFSSKNGEKIADFYDQYVEKCRQNQNQQLCSKDEKTVADTYKYRSGVSNGEKIADFYKCADKSRQNQQVRSKGEKKVSDTYKCRSGVCNSEKIADYTEKIQQNQQVCSKKEKKASYTYQYRSGVSSGGRKINRSQSEKLGTTAHVDDRRRELRRSMTDKYGKGVDYGRKEEAAPAPVTYAEDELSSEEFQRTVEAFIARRRRFLREEKDYPPVVPLIGS